jgi:hypothetical protein
LFVAEIHTKVKDYQRQMRDAFIGYSDLHLSEQIESFSVCYRRRAITIGLQRGKTMRQRFLAVSLSGMLAFSLCHAGSVFLCVLAHKRMTIPASRTKPTKEKP